MSETRVATIRLRCPDPRATAAFYHSAFMASHLSRDNDLGVLPMRLGLQRLEFVAGAEPACARAPSNSTAFQHFAIVVSDMTSAMERFSRHLTWKPISRAGPELLPEGSGGATAFKFRDPDGRPLELLEFPVNRVPECWRAPPGAGPFLGIDHSAITVADVDRSIAFYSRFGFEATNRQVNRGPEQERLDDVDGAVVEVVTLASPGAGPPHIELLSYRQPGVVPCEAAPKIELVLQVVGGLEKSPRVERPSKFDRAKPAGAQFHDPDGHCLRLLG